MDRRLKSRIPAVPYDRMFPYFIYDSPDKANELKALFDKYKRGEIPGYTFVSLLKEIVGDDQLLLSAAAKLRDHVRKKRNLPVTDNEQLRTLNFMTPYDRLFPFMFPEIHQDKANKVQALFDKYKREEIDRNTFYACMKKIVGEELILSASEKMRDHELQKRNLPATVNEQPRTQINFMPPVVPYDRMFPFLFLEIHQDKANEILALFDKYKRGEIPKDNFVSLMKGIAGEEKLRSAAAKLKQQKGYLQVTVNEQSVVPYDQMFPFLFPVIDQYKAGELKDLFDKYKRDEIPRDTFYSLMKDIVGEELLLSASEKLIQVSELFRTQISFRLPVVAYDQMFPFLFPEIHKDKADEIQVSFDKYKRGEIPKYDFVSLLKGIAGEEKLRSVEAKMKHKGYLRVTVNEQPRTQINSSEQVFPFDQLFPFLISLIEPDKAIRLQTLFDQYKTGEIGEHTFVPNMKGILGDQMLISATRKVEQQKRNLLVPINKKPRTQINSSELVLPFDQLFPFLISYIEPDKAIELDAFFDKYKRREIDEHTFRPVMKGILGEQMLILATAKMKQQKITNAGSSSASLNAVTNHSHNTCDEKEMKVLESWTGSLTL